MTTRDPKECSNRGTCDSTVGKCLCYDGYSFLSDGKGGPASEEYRYRDCGHINPYWNNTKLECPSVEPQWGGVKAVCSGKQLTCNETTLACNCTAGYSGGACEWLECPKGLAWFDEATSSTEAHELAECSNRGECQRSSGTCTCDDNFEGAACSKLSCALNETFVCGDKGACMTMSKLATYSTTNGNYNDATYTKTPATWDAHKIQNCYCRKALSANSYYWHHQQVSNEYTITHSTYRGFNAYTHTDYTSYDCSFSECPRGDNPDTPLGKNEIQRLNCSANSGSFFLTFRENTTDEIYWNENIYNFKIKLAKLLSVGNITISYHNISNDGGASSAGHGSAKGVCNTTYVDIEFNSELGDLPLITMSGSTLLGKLSFENDAINKGVNITEVVKGTRENIECSGKGYCNYDIGMCTCDTGYISSDGHGNPGHRGDCGFHYTETEFFLPKEEEEEEEEY
jgi:hypothetical protein